MNISSSIWIGSTKFKWMSFVCLILIAFQLKEFRWMNTFQSKLQDSDLKRIVWNSMSITHINIDQYWSLSGFEIDSFPLNKYGNKMTFNRNISMGSNESRTNCRRLSDRASLYNHWSYCYFMLQSIIIMLLICGIMCKIFIFEHIRPSTILMIFWVCAFYCELSIDSDLSVKNHYFTNSKFCFLFVYPSFRMTSRNFATVQRILRPFTTRNFSSSSPAANAAQSFKLVNLTVDDSTGIATLEMNRPPVNTLNAPLLQDISSALTEVEKNGSKGLILTSVCKVVIYSFLLKSKDADSRLFFLYFPIKMKSSRRQMCFRLAWIFWKCINPNRKELNCFGPHCKKFGWNCMAHHIRRQQQSM